MQKQSERIQLAISQMELLAEKLRNEKLYADAMLAFENFSRRYEEYCRVMGLPENKTERNNEGE